jgi:hypothetical protein
MRRQQHRAKLAALILLTTTLEAAEPPKSEPTPPPTGPHWSFEPIHRPTPPAVANEAWVVNDIDRFILSRLESAQLAPAPPADSTALLRRLTADLSGLPPSLSEQADAARDTSPTSWTRRIDALLADTAYGERWGRHWLDLVRYADTNGYERDSDKPYAWRYRDYVIRSFNADKPFHQFVAEQIAGDMLATDDGAALVGLGFYLLGPWNDEPDDPAQAELDELDDVVVTLSQAVLGINIGCSRCHDHKYDPITQVDYYSLASIVRDARRPLHKGRETGLPIGSRSDRERLAEIQTRIADADAERKQLEDRVRPLVFRDKSSGLPDSAREAMMMEALDRTPEQEQMVLQYASLVENRILEAMDPADRDRYLGIQRRIDELRQSSPQLPLVYIPRFADPSPTPLRVLHRGDLTDPRQEVEPNLPNFLPARVGKTSNDVVSRRDLADWLTSPDNPLTPRVIINRVWQHHFGQGLVPTPDDFGRAGQPPTHPELLDYLAHWFVHDAGWSLKRLHRLILSSQTYRMSQQASAEALLIDPDDRLLSRFPRRRLDAEVIIDSMLAVSGKLNRKMYGPPTYPRVRPELLASHETAARTWGPFDEREASRRAVYTVVKRSLQPPIFEALDACSGQQTVVNRPVTLAAPQLLVNLNDDFVSKCAEAFAQRLQDDRPDQPREQILLAYRLALAREPASDEVDALLEVWNDEHREGASPGLAESQRSVRAMSQVARVIFNLNEFYYAD